MREILFRGKRDDNGEWVYGYYACIGKHHYILTGKLNLIGAVNFEHYLVIPETVGQYTGLTDKNGKKIFEGDIVMFSRNRNLPNFTPVPEVIRYHYGDCAFQRFPYNKSLTKGKSGRLLQPDMMCECEVIGNIHDNPELLEGGEKNGKNHICKRP